MLVPPESPLAVPVMISSMSVSIYNRSHARRANSGLDIRILQQNEMKKIKTVAVDFIKRCRLVEQGLTFHSTQFRSFWRQCFYRSDDPTNSIKALKEGG